MSKRFLVNFDQPPIEQSGIIFRTGNDTRTVLKITHDGRLEKGEDFSTEQAAQVMFDAVSDHLTGIWKQTRDRLNQLEKENAELRSKIGGAA